MGYDTRFSLTIEPENFELLAKIWDEREDDYGFCYALTREGGTADSCKWYDWELEMRLISRQYPDVLFHLHGEGREAGDVWDATFQGSKAHIRRAKIEIEPFDPSKLE